MYSVENLLAWCTVVLPYRYVNYLVATLSDSPLLFRESLLHSVEREREREYEAMSRTSLLLVPSQLHVEFRPTEDTLLLTDRCL